MALAVRQLRLSGGPPEPLARPCLIACHLASLVATGAFQHSARPVSEIRHTTRCSPLNPVIASELAVKPQQVAATVALLDAGSTVPFIARYRKEATEGLDDAQLRTLEGAPRLPPRAGGAPRAILKSIEEQGKLTGELKTAIGGADTKQRLEDLYLPYKPKRRTKAMIAREAGLDGLAEALLANPALGTPRAEAAKYLKPAFTTDNGENPGAPDTKTALDGARQVLMERFAEDAELLGKLREHLQENGQLVAKVAAGKEEAGAKFRDYFDYREAISAIPSHRGLALFRGRKEEILQLALKLPEGARRAAGRDVRPGSGALQQLREPHRRSFPDRRPEASGGCVAAADGPLDVAGEARLAARGRAVLWACASAPRKRRFAFSPAICTICCWRLPRDRAPPWASIPACVRE